MFGFNFAPAINSISGMLARLFGRGKVVRERPFYPPMPPGAKPPAHDKIDPQNNEPTFATEKNSDNAWGQKADLQDTLRSLADYFSIIGKMKSKDPDAYEAYSRIGGRIASRDKLFSNDLPTAWKDQSRRASAGFFHMPSYYDPVEDDKVGVRFAYFQKQEHRQMRDIIIEPTNGDVYCFTVVYDGKKDPLAFIDFYISIEGDGTVRLLKEHCINRIKLKRKKNMSGGHIPIKQWSVPNNAKIMFEESENPFGKTPSGHIENLFLFYVNMATYGEEGFQVRAQKGSIAATFFIPLDASAKFFAKRVKTRMPSGRAKPIFHITRPHERVRNGKASSVKMHFRGERVFPWMGYDIRITVPGIHHRSLLDFTGRAQIVFDGEKSIDATVGQRQFSEAVRDHMVA